MRLNKRMPVEGVTFGEGQTEAKTVPIRKITVGQWQELFTVIESLPQLVLTVLSAPPEDRAGYFVIALRESLGEGLSVVALLSGLDKDWLRGHASLDEVVAFFTATAKANNFGALLKNAQSVLNLSAAAKAPLQDAL
ncbi:hypothetical protein [Gorillibacterium sp. sgz500922]|uniref:hypothetical protein n=1 Tax=Gorillibacterium sp. sgz500922 TaxID=3446694 RepID=UPI003F66B2DF